MNQVRQKIDLSKLALDSQTRSIFQNEIDDVLTFRRHISALESELERFSATLAKKYETFEFLDMSLANELARVSEKLLEHASANPWNDEVPFVVAAIRYFLNEQDSLEDFSAVDGFEDDKRVLDAVIQTFNLNSIVKLEV